MCQGISIIHLFANFLFPLIKNAQMSSKRKLQADDESIRCLHGKSREAKIQIVSKSCCGKGNIQIKGESCEVIDQGWSEDSVRRSMTELYFNFWRPAAYSLATAYSDS